MAERQLLCRVLKEEEPGDYICEFYREASEGKDFCNCRKPGKVRVEYPNKLSSWYCKKHVHQGVKVLVKGEVEE